MGLVYGLKIVHKKKSKLLKAIILEKNCGKTVHQVVQAAFKRSGIGFGTSTNFIGRFEFVSPINEGYRNPYQNVRTVLNHRSEC